MHMEIPGAKILVIGGTGLLGANLVRLLLAEGGSRPGDIRVLYRAGDPVDSLAPIAGLELVPGEITEAREVLAACEGRGLVFHCAAVLSFEARMRERQWMVNVEGTRNVLDAVARSPSVRRLVYTSSVNVLGKPEPRGPELPDPYAGASRIHSFSSSDEILAFADSVREGRAGAGWPRRIRAGYHDSKLAAQELVLEAARSGRVDAVSVLPGTFLGAYGGLEGSAQYLAAVRDGRLPAALRVRLPFMHAEDAARCHLLAARLGKAGERYIARGRDEDILSLREMAALMAEVLAAKRAVLEVPRALAFAAAALSETWSALSGGPCALPLAAVRAAAYDSAYSNAKASRELGYEPRRSFREAIGEAYDWLRSRGLMA